MAFFRSSSTPNLPLLHPPVVRRRPTLERLRSQERELGPFRGVVRRGSSPPSTFAPTSPPTSPTAVMEIRVGEYRFRTDQKLGSGSFGTVYAGVENRTGRLVAVKIEPIGRGPGILAHEANVILALSGGEGMPRYLAWASVTLPLPVATSPSRPTSRLSSPRSTPPASPSWNDYAVMIMDRLGVNLETLFARSGRRFRLETWLGIAVQLVDRIEFIHSRGFLHRDLKPDNVVVGLAARDAGRLFVVDFGFAEAFKTRGIHVEPQTGGRLIGTQMFMSRAASQGLQSSRRDDLESLGYILLSFLAPLPWAPLARQMDVQYMQAGGRVTPVVTDLLRRIEASKEGYIRGARERRVVDLRRGEEALAAYFRRVSSLAFEERPDYSSLRALFDRCRDANGFRRSSRIDFGPSSLP